MNPLVKVLIWLAMAVVIAVGILYIDVQRAAAKACRVSIQTELQASEILARFPFEPGYLPQVVDAVPKTDWQILLRLFDRHNQLVLVKRFVRLDRRQEASIVASCVPMRSRSGDLVVGLDRAAKSWLDVTVDSLTPQQLDELAKHKKRSRSGAGALPNPAKPPLPASPPRPPVRRGGATATVG